MAVKKSMAVKNSKKSKGHKAERESGSSPYMWVLLGVVMSAFFLMLAFL